MRWIYYAFCAAYFGFLVWAIFAPWHSGAAGYSIAALWFAIYFFYTRENDKLRATIRKNGIREITDFLKFTKEVLKLVAEMGNEYEKEIAALKTELGRKDALIDAYGRFEEKRKATKKRRR